MLTTSRWEPGIQPLPTVLKADGNLSSVVLAGRTYAFRGSRSLGSRIIGYQNCINPQETTHQTALPDSIESSVTIILLRPQYVALFSDHHRCGRCQPRHGGQGTVGTLPTGPAEVASEGRGTQCKQIPLGKTSQENSKGLKPPRPYRRQRQRAQPSE